MELTYKNCQSCDMPLRKDAKGGGTNADESRIAKFCSPCWADGQYTWPDATVGEMQELVVGKLKEFGFPRFVGRFFTRGIPRLERWKS